MSGYHLRIIIMFIDFFFNTIKKIYRPKLATTKEEKEAVFKFRYKVYIQELKQYFIDADHENKMISNKYDYDANTIIFYVGDIPNISATLTLRVWDKGTIPEEIKNHFSLNLFPNIDDLTIAEFGSYVQKKSQRGNLSFLVLGDAFLQYGKQRNPPIDLYFCSCVPGLIKYYANFGFQLYANKFFHLVKHLQVPLLAIPSDWEYLKKNRSLISFILKKYTTRGKKPPMSPIQNYFSTNIPVYTSKTAIHKVIADAKIDANSCEFLKHVSIQELEMLCQLALSFEPNQYVISEDVLDKEIYIILEGSFEILVHGVRVKVLEKGAVFGEVAFFLGEGRTADIRSVTAGTVAVIRRNDLNRVIKNNKKLGIKVLFALSSILSLKLIATTDELSKYRFDP